MRFITTTNHLFVIYFKTSLKLIFWMIYLLISSYALKSRVVINSSLGQIGSEKPKYFGLIVVELSFKNCLSKIIYWESSIWKSFIKRHQSLVVLVFVLFLNPLEFSALSKRWKTDNFLVLELQLSFYYLGVFYQLP